MRSSKSSASSKAMRRALRRERDEPDARTHAPRGRRPADRRPGDPPGRDRDRRRGSAAPRPPGCRHRSDRRPDLRRRDSRRGPGMAPQRRHRPHAQAPDPPRLQERIGELRRAEERRAKASAAASVAAITAERRRRRRAFILAARELLGHEVVTEVWARAAELKPDVFTDGIPDGGLAMTMAMDCPWPALAAREAGRPAGGSRRPRDRPGDRPARPRPDRTWSPGAVLARASSTIGARPPPLCSCCW